MKPRYLSWDDVKGQCLEIVRQLYADNWRPDYLVGITRGGVVPGAMLSHFMNLPLETVKVSLRDDGQTESNLYMAEDAFGYSSETDLFFLGDRKKILIVDDINDSGATLSWIKNDWEENCFKGNPDWNNIWHKSVRFASLVNNSSSQFTVDYAALEINKLENDEWIVFPWENWWAK